MTQLLNCGLCNAIFARVEINAIAKISTVSAVNCWCCRKCA